MPDLTLRLKGDSSDLVKSIEDVEKSIEKIDDAESFGRLTKAGIAAKAQVEALRATVEKLGDKATPELRAEVERLERSFNDSFAGGKKRVGELADEIGDARSAARGLHGDTFDLQDLFQAAFPKAAQSVGVFVSALGAGAVAMEALGKALDFVEKNFSPLTDAMAEQFGLAKDNATAVGAAIHDITHPLEVLQGKSESWTIALGKAREEWGHLIGQTSEAADAQKVLTEFTTKHEAALKKVADEQERQLEAIQKQALGTTYKELIDQVNGLVDSYKLLQSLGLEESGPLSDKLHDRAKDLQAIFEKLGPAVAKVLPPEVLKLWDEYKDKLVKATDASKGAAESSEKLAKSQQQLAKDAAKVVAELEKQAESLEKARQGIEDLSNDAGISLESLIGKFEELDQVQKPERVVELQNQISDLSDEYESLGEQVVTTAENEDRRTEILEEIERLTRQLGEVQSQTSKEQRDAQIEFNKLLAEYEQDIRELPKEVQPALQAVIDRFQAQNEQVGSNIDTIRKFKSEWVTNLDTARRTVEGFGDQTQAAMSKAQAAAEDAASAIGVAWDDASSHADGYLAKLGEIEAAQKRIAEGAAAIANSAEENF